MYCLRSSLDVIFVKKIHLLLTSFGIQVLRYFYLFNFIEQFQNAGAFQYSLKKVFSSHRLAMHYNLKFSGYDVITVYKIIYIVRNYIGSSVPLFLQT
jgi:hypothetical protein